MKSTHLKFDHLLPIAFHRVHKFNFLKTSSTLDIYFVFHFANQVVGKQYLAFVSIYVSLVTDKITHLSMYLLNLSYILFSGIRIHCSLLYYEVFPVVKKKWKRVGAGCIKTQKSVYPVSCLSFLTDPEFHLHQNDPILLLLRTQESNYIRK